MSTEVKWGVVATVKEPLDLTLAFVAHHLALGATEVHVYFDDHNDPAYPIVRKIDGCTVTRCGPRYWNRECQMDRPEFQTERQAYNAAAAKKIAQVDWLLHIDADEFLFLTRPLAEDLALLGPGQRGLRLPTLERVCLQGSEQSTVFSGVFRHEIQGNDALLKRVYSENLMPFVGAGLTGAGSGKAFFATGGDGLSVAARTDGFPMALGAQLLHFDGLTPLHWAAKTLRYGEYPDADLNDLLPRHRAAQVRYVRDECEDLYDVLDFYDSLTTLSLGQAEVLSAHGKLIRCPIDPEAALKSVLPAHRPGFSQGAFDEGLGRENAARLMHKIEGLPAQVA